MSKYDELKRLAEAECILSELGSFENPHLCATILELITDAERNERMLLAACMDMGAIGEALGADMNGDGEELLSMIADMKAERDALLAERDAAQKDAERRVPLYEAIERACGELPDGWSIMLCAEHHAGTVELYGPDGSREEFPTNNERLDYTVIDALEHALQGEQP